MLKTAFILRGPIYALRFYGNTDLTDTTDLHGFSFLIRRF
jgi:hypothetical protein